MKYSHKLYRSMSKMAVVSALVGAGLAHAEASFVAPHFTEPAAAPDVTSLSDPDSNLGETSSVTEITPEMRTQILGEAQRALHRLNADIQKQLEQRDELTPEVREGIARADREGRDALARELNILRLRDADLNPSSHFVGGIMATYDVDPRFKIKSNLSGDVGGKLGFVMYATARGLTPSGIRVTPVASVKGGLVFRPSVEAYGRTLNTSDFNLKFYKGLKLSFIIFAKNPDGFPVGNLQDAAGLYVGIGAEMSRDKYPSFVQNVAKKHFEWTHGGATVYAKAPLTFMNRIGEFSSASFGMPGIFVVELQGHSGLDKPASLNVSAQYLFWPASNNGDGALGYEWM